MRQGKLSDLSFTPEKVNRQESDFIKEKEFQSLTRIINFKRGIRIVARDVTATEELSVDYSHPLPENATMGAVSLIGTSLSRLYDTGVALTHHNSNFHWGHVPGERAASVYPAGKRFTMLYLSITHELIDPEIYRESRQDNPLLPYLLGSSCGVYESEGDTAECSRLLDSLLRNPLESPLDWLSGEAMVLDLLYRLLSRETEKPAEAPARTEKLSHQERTLIYYAREVLLKDLDAPPTIPDLAEATGINECKLKQQFKEVFGLPIYEYLRRYRVEKAVKLIESGFCSVTEAALSVGYTNPSALSRAVQQIYGVAPQEIKRRSS